MRIKHLFYVAIAALTVSTVSAANILSIGKTKTAPVIDGKMNDSCWKNTLLVTGFTIPGTLKYAEHQTVLRMVRDDRYLYGAFRCMVGSSKFPKQKALKDYRDIWKNDALELFFIGKGDVRQFIIDSNGSYFDNRATEVAVDDAIETAWRNDPSFEGLEKFAVHRGDKYWEAEFAIPLSKLPAGKLTFNAVRDMPKNTQSSSWMMLEVPLWWNFTNCAELRFVDNVPGAEITKLPTLNKDNTASVVLSGDKKYTADLIVQGKAVAGKAEKNAVNFRYQTVASSEYKGMRLVLQIKKDGNVIYAFEYEQPSGYVKFTPANLTNNLMYLNSSLKLKTMLGWETRHNYQGFKVRKDTKIHFEVPEGVQVMNAKITGKTTRNGKKYVRYTQTEKWAFNGKFWMKSNFATTLPDHTTGVIYYSSETPESKQPEKSFTFKVVGIPSVTPPKKFITGHYDNWVRTLSAAMEWKKTGTNTFPLRNASEQSIKLAHQLKKAGFYLRRGDYFWPNAVHSGGTRDFSRWAEKDRSARAKDIAGFYIASGNAFQLSPSYRGKFYEEAIVKEIEFCKKAGINWFAFDLEGYIQPRGEAADFTDRTLKLFREYWQKKYPGKACPDPKKFEAAPEKFPNEHKEWVQFKCEIWADFFAGIKRRFQKELDKPEYNTSPFGGVVFSDWNTGRPFTLAQQNKMLRNAEYFKVFNIMEIDAYSSLDRNLREIEWHMGQMKKHFPEVNIKWILTPAPDRLYGGVKGFYVTTAPQLKNERKYMFMEAMTLGVKGFYTWYTPLIHMEYLRQYAEGVKMLNKIEDIVLNGKPLKLSTNYPDNAEIEEFFYGKKSVWKNQKQVFVRGLKLGNKAIISVGEYRKQKEMNVTVNYHFEKDTLITDLETGEKIAEVRGGSKSFSVVLPKDRRCRLFLLEER